MAGLGELLVRESMISVEQLQEAQSETRRSGVRLGASLVKLGMLEEGKLLEFLSRQYHVPSINLDDFEIDVALAQLIKGYEQNGTCRVTFLNKTDTRVDTSQMTRLVVYRATNELIVNVLKHARAESAVVELTNDGTEICVKVEDDGVGFDWQRVQKTKLSAVGLISVSERIKNAGGAFGVFSRPGQGSRILFSLPFHPESPG